MDLRTQLTFWLNMQEAHYPFAQRTVDRLRQRIAEEGEMAMMQKTIDNLSKDNANREAYGKQLLGAARAQREELGKYKDFARYTDERIEQERAAAKEREKMAIKQGV
jgi:hypothetical protein